MAMVLMIIVNSVFFLYELLLVLRVLLSWMPVIRRNIAVHLVYVLTDPIVIPCGKLIQDIASALRADLSGFPVDFSPMLAFLIIDLFLRRVALFVLNHFIH